MSGLPDTPSLRRWVDSCGGVDRKPEAELRYLRARIVAALDSGRRVYTIAGELGKRDARALVEAIDAKLDATASQPYAPSHSEERTRP